MALVVLASTLATASAALSPIHVRDGHFVDQSGRVRLFHGINSVIKRFPWYDEGMRDPARHKQIAEWGFTAVRSFCFSHSNLICPKYPCLEACI